MIMAYPNPWSINATPPVYLVTGDKAFYLYDQQTSANMQKVGIPMVPFAPQAMDWILIKLAPNVEHPLGAYTPDPTPQPVIDGGFPNTPYFLVGIDGDDPDDVDGFDGAVDGGTP